MGLTNKQKKYIADNKGKGASKIASALNTDISEIEAYLDELREPVQISSAKKKLFTVILLAIPILFFLLLEAGLRFSDYKGNTDLFIQPEELNEQYLFPNPNFAARYFFNTSIIPNPSRDAFLAEKPENGFRLFAIGGSSAAAFPFGFNATFSRVVEDVLIDAMPDKEVEVINTGISAINSYTLYDEMDEILEQKPDGILIYAGHNEFYGALGVGSSESLGKLPGLVRFYLNLQNLRTVMLIRDAYVNLMKVMFSPSEDQGGTLMSRVVKEQEIIYQSDLFEAGLNQFESNLEAILRKASDAGIPVFVGTLASNERDHEPFVSVRTDQYPPADEVYAEAEQMYYEKGNFTEAKEKYIYARQLDALRFRAPTEFNTVINDLAQKFNAQIVDVDQGYRDVSSHGIIGNNLMMEHLHPNLHGYFLMGKFYAEAVLDYPEWQPILQKDRVVSWNEYDQKRYLTELDSLIGAHRIRSLMNSWPFVPIDQQPTVIPRYNPFSAADSLAWQVVNNDMTWEKAKVTMAEYYRTSGDENKALSEYFGLMRDIPYNDSAPKMASQILMKKQRFDEAKSVLLTAYNIKPTEYTCRMLGSIEVNDKNYEKGIQYLQESLTFDPDDIQSLYNLSGAYALTGDFEQAYELAQKINNVDPRYPNLQPWLQQLQQALRQKKIREQKSE